MPSVRALAGAVAVALLAAGAADPSESGPAARAANDRVGAAAPRALLVAGAEGPAIVSLTGQRLLVPARVREFSGLSPDARLIAGIAPADNAVSVVLGPVRGGLMKTVLRGGCSSPPCPYGTDPTYAWSPDGRLLAAAANPARGATLLKLVGRDGRVLRAFALPAVNPEQRGRAYHRVLSWSPDGSRLLLLRGGDFGPTAVLTLVVATGRLRTLSRFAGPRADPSATWSPDGRFVALAGEGYHDSSDLFEVVDAASGRRILTCSSIPRCERDGAPGRMVWAADGRSVLASVLVRVAPRSTRIDRFSLAGRRTTAIGPAAGELTPHLSTPAGLVYAHGRPSGQTVLYLQRVGTSERIVLLTSRVGIGSVVPLLRAP